MAAVVVWVHRGWSPARPPCPTPGSHQLQLLGQDPPLQALVQQAVLGGTQCFGEMGLRAPWACGSREDRLGYWGPEVGTHPTWDLWGHPSPEGSRRWDLCLPWKCCIAFSKITPCPSVFLNHNLSRVCRGLHWLRAFVGSSSPPGLVALQGGY